MSISVQRLAPEHAAEYRALMLEAYDTHPDVFTSSHAERAALPLSWWRRRLREEERAAEVVFGAMAADMIAGVAGLSFDGREKACHKATLFGMYVPAAQRGRGIGRRLVECVLAAAAARPGVRLVQLTVTEGNAVAERLYQRCGFVRFGLEPYAVAVGDGFVTKVHMWREVGPTGVLE